QQRVLRAELEREHALRAVLAVEQPGVVGRVVEAARLVAGAHRPVEHALLADVQLDARAPVEVSGRDLVVLRHRLDAEAVGPEAWVDAEVTAPVALRVLDEPRLLLHALPRRRR